MALRLGPTLQEVRRAVAIRLNFGAQAEQSPALRDKLDEMIRKAARWLQLECHWVELRIRFDAPLIDGQAIYEFPDNMDPGRIERVMVVDDEGRVYELKAGIRPSERSQYENGDDNTGLPLRYEFINEDILILPAPDTESYTTLQIEGYSRPLDPQNPDDRLPLDKEALVQAATVGGKYEFKHPDAKKSEEDLALYIARLRPTQTEGETFRIGGHFSGWDRYYQRRGTRDLSLENYWLDPDY